MAALTATAAAVPALAPTAAAEPSTTQDPLVMRYSSAAPLNGWEQALPIGSGGLGALVHGQVNADELFLNEKTLWSGGPGVPGYRNGNYPTDQIPQRRANLQQVRDTINTTGQMTPDSVAALLGQPKLGYGSYLSFGKLAMAFTHDAGSPSSYERTLDLNKALATVRYTVGGTTFTREYFASHPDNVVVARITADQPGKVTFATTYNRNTSGSAGLAAATITAADTGRIQVSGALSDNGLKYNAQTQITADGGTVTAAGETVTVTGANSAWLVWSAATDYKLEYPTYRNGETAAQLQARVAGTVDGAVAKGFAALQSAHEADYKELFDRVKLDLGGAPLTGTTDAARASYTGARAVDRSMEVLYYQYGRYLLISSSRDGSLPANLQGVWARNNTSPWSADYHVNINLQMNYWPAFSANLAETTGTYHEYVKDLAKAGRDSVANIFGYDKGWMVMNETTPYGFTGVFDWATAFWFPDANAWLAQSFYWQYLYTRDTAYLRDEAWPVLKGAADFWAEYLVNDPRDNTLVANPSYSPEHGPFTAGAAMTQQIATEVLESTIEAAEVLGKQSEVSELQAVLDKIDQGLHIGTDGKLQEWKTPGITGEPGHRHVSHLYALWPGRNISPETTPDLADAAYNSLLDRGFAGTGWSKAWKINFWAHLKNGNNSHRMLSSIISGNTFANLWDFHAGDRFFQIDGNLGATSGVNEMLVQNDGDRVSVLPALPDAWTTGSVDGIKAWNNVTVGATWASGNATEIRIDTTAAGPVKVETPMAAAGVTVTDGSGATVPATVADGVVTFTGTAGGSYTLAPVKSITFTTAPASMDIATDATLTVDITGAPALSQLQVVVPAGWQASPSTQWVAEGDSTASFTVRAPASGTSGTIVAKLVSPDGVLQASTAIALNDTTAVPSSATKVAGWNTQEPTGEGPPNGLISSAVDGNTGTFWHSRWSGAVTPFPHYIIVDLGEERSIAGLTYVPRNVGGTPKNGQIGTYKLEAATAGTFVPPTQAQLTTAISYPEPADAAWAPVTNGTWPIATSAVQTASFTPVTTRYVKLTSTGGFSDSGGQFTHIAELSFRGAAPVVEDLDDDPADARITVSPSTVTAGESVTVAGGGFAPGAAVTITVGSGTPVPATADAAGYVSEEVVVPATQAAGTVTVTASAGSTTATADLTVKAAASPSPTVSPTTSPTVSPTTSPTTSPTVSPTTSPTTSPTVSPTGNPTTSPTASPQYIDLYTTPGFHIANGRRWYTACEPFSQTVRCRTEIWATTVVHQDGKFQQVTGWVFNNLTYLPMMTRAQWGTDFRANPGLHQVNGRTWFTECDSALTGRNNCRTSIWAQVIVTEKNAAGAWTYRWEFRWILNNMVRFAAS